MISLIYLFFLHKLVRYPVTLTTFMYYYFLSVFKLFVLVFIVYFVVLFTVHLSYAFVCMHTFAHYRQHSLIKQMFI